MYPPDHQLPPVPPIYTLFMLPGKEKSSRTGWHLLAGEPASGHMYYQAPYPTWADLPSLGGSTSKVSVLHLGMKLVKLVTTYIFETSDEFNWRWSLD